MSLPSRAQASAILDQTNPGWRTTVAIEYAGISGLFRALSWQQALLFIGSGGDPTQLCGPGRGIVGGHK